MILGIDPASKHVGVRLWDPATCTSPWGDVIELKAKKADDRLCALEYKIDDALAMVCDKWGPPTVVVEQMFRRDGHSAKADQVLAEAAGICRRMAMKRGLKLESVLPSQARKLAFGAAPGKRDSDPKAWVMAMLRMRWGITITQPDEADALTLALAVHVRQQDRMGTTMGRRRR